MKTDTNNWNIISELSIVEGLEGEEGESEGGGGWKRRGEVGGGEWEEEGVHWWIILKLKKSHFWKIKSVKKILSRELQIYIYIYILGTCRNILDPYKLLESLFIVRLKPVLESDKTSVPLLIVNA